MDRAENLSVSALTVDDETVNASVRNASGSAKSGTIILQHNGAEVTRAPFQVAAGATVDVPFAWKRAAAGTITALDRRPVWLCRGQLATRSAARRASLRR